MYDAAQILKHNPTRRSKEVAATTLQLMLSAFENL
jgi:hypothetical protein